MRNPLPLYFSRHETPFPFALNLRAVQRTLHLHNRALPLVPQPPRPARKLVGFIEVPAHGDAAASIPVAVFQGTKPGPVLALVSGSHGTEYASIIALERVIQTLDRFADFRHRDCLPLVNIPSFLQKVPHVNPVDNKSMNRFYPGNRGRNADGPRFLCHHQTGGGALRLSHRLSWRRSG